MCMHVLVGVNLFPRWKSGGESPGFHDEADPSKDGNPWVIRAPEGAWERVEVPRQGRWGSNVCDNWGRREVVARGE